MCMNIRDFFLNLLYKHLLNTNSQLLLCVSFLVFLEFFGSFCFLCLPFCHAVGGRDSLKKRKIHQENKGWAFQFFTNTNGGWVGVKPAALGVFLVQSGRFWVVPKFKYLNLGSSIWILALYIWILSPCTWDLSPYICNLAPHIWILASHIWILAPKLKNRVFSKGCGGVVGGSPGPRTSGRFRHRCREKKFRPPLGNILMLKLLWDMDYLPGRGYRDLARLLGESWWSKKWGAIPGKK